MRTLKEAYKHRFCYLIFLPVLAYYLLFAYAPMLNPQTGGVLMAFKEFRINTAFADMKWVGLKWFQTLWGKPDFWVAIRNTLIISFSRLIIEFPIPIILAILLNEVRGAKPRRFLQTVFTFPNFLSWVLVLGVMRDLMQPAGLLNIIRNTMGQQPFNFLANGGMLPNLLLVVITNVWKSAGWTAIIYMASISGIDPSLYEAAIVDGANRWHCIWHVTWPGIKSTAVVLLILSCGNILNAGFDQLFNMKNGVNKGVLDILDTYIYNYAFSGTGASMNQSFAVAAGLFKSSINFVLLLSANRIVGLLGEEKLF